MAATHWLTPVAERLARADELATSARALATRYEASSAVAIVKSREGADTVLRLRQTSPPPPRLPLMIGEAIHQLRAALDNLIVLLADRSTGSRIDTATAKSLQFPIASSRGEFVRASKRLACINDDYVSRIEQVQPYHLMDYAFGQAAQVTIDREPLSELRELSNHDKHRRIHVVLHRASGLQVHRQQSDPRTDLVLSRMPLSDGDIVARVAHANVDEVQAQLELMLEHPISGQPLRLESLIDRLVWMLTNEVIPHVADDRDLLGHPTRPSPKLD